MVRAVSSWLAIGLLSLTCLSLPRWTWAEDLRVIGHIKTSAGAVTLARQQRLQPAAPGVLLYEGDILQTGLDASTATLTLVDGTNLALGPRTRLVLRHFRWNPTTQAGQMRAELGAGTLKVRSGALGQPHSGNSLAIVTPRATVRVTDAQVGLRVIEKE